MRPLLRSAESAARGFAVTGDPDFVREHREASAAFLAAFDDLIGTVTQPRSKPNCSTRRRALVARQIAISSELIRLHTAGDQAGIAALMARPEGRTVTDEIAANLEKVTCRGTQAADAAPRRRPRPTGASCWRSIWPAWR